MSMTHSVFTVILFWLPSATTVQGQQQSLSPEHHGPCRPEMKGAKEYRRPALEDLPAVMGGSTVECDANNMASRYPCSNVDLESFVPLTMLTGGTQEETNDIWGWTNNVTGAEYAIIGTYMGTSFVDISVPSSPIVAGFLPTHTTESSWGDIKTYGNFAFKISDAMYHGLQIFNMLELENQGDITAPFRTLAETVHYSDRNLGNAHNMFINEDTGFAYIVGCFSSCNGGLHIVNVQDPMNPKFAGCFGELAYIHDVQCVIYDGPDTIHKGKEICFASHESNLAIIDVTNKRKPQLISKFRYSGVRYVHQGWLTADQRHFLINDEDDKGKTKTFICDVSNLDRPVLVATHVASYEAIDHNIFIKDWYAYQAQYRAGLRIFDLHDLDDNKMTEVGYFDVYPKDNAHEFNGAFGVYPFFDSGIVIVSGIEQGLYVLRPRIASPGPTISHAPTRSSSPTKSPSDTAWPTPGIGLDDGVFMRDDDWWRPEEDCREQIKQLRKTIAKFFGR